MAQQPPQTAPTPAEAFDQVVNRRRSVRVFDADAAFDPEAVARSIDRALLSPNSSNLQLWEFYRVRSPQALAKARPICLNQNAAKTARELVVVVVRRDKWRQHAKANLDFLKSQFDGSNPKRERQALDYYSKLMPIAYTNDPVGVAGLAKKSFQTAVGLVRPMYREAGWNDMRVSAHKSVALAAQTFMLSIAAEGLDSCPMEGFDSARMKSLLGLPLLAEVSMVIGVGPRKPEGVYGPRFRVPREQVVFEL